MSAEVHDPDSLSRGSTFEVEPAYEEFEYFDPDSPKAKAQLFLRGQYLGRDEKGEPLPKPIPFDKPIEVNDFLEVISALGGEDDAREAADFLRERKVEENAGKIMIFYDEKTYAYEFFYQEYGIKSAQPSPDDVGQATLSFGRELKDLLEEEKKKVKALADAKSKGQFEQASKFAPEAVEALSLLAKLKKIFNEDSELAREIKAKRDELAMLVAELTTFKNQEQVETKRVAVAEQELEATQLRPVEVSARPQAIQRARSALSAAKFGELHVVNRRVTPQIVKIKRWTEKLQKFAELATAAKERPRRPIDIRRVLETIKARLEETKAEENDADRLLAEELEGRFSAKQWSIYAEMQLRSLEEKYNQRAEVDESI